jgi:hypothetical protein
VGLSQARPQAGPARGAGTRPQPEHGDPLLSRDCPIWRVLEGTSGSRSGSGSSGAPPDPDSLPPPSANQMGRPPWALPGGTPVPGVSGGGMPIGGFTFQLPRAVAGALGG